LKIGVPSPAIAFALCTERRCVPWYRLWGVLSELRGQPKIGPLHDRRGWIDEEMVEMKMPICDPVAVHRFETF
jgi:hypothetical protein